MKIKKVLIVEDNASSIMMLEALIKEIDIKTFCYRASNLTEAYQILHSCNIDLFLLDIILDSKSSGDLSGIELAKEIRAMERHKFTPIVFVTSVEDPCLFAYEELHSYGYIMKPYHVEKTKKIIKNALEFNHTVEEDKIVFLRRDCVMYAIKENDIVYVESKKYMLSVYKRDGILEFPYKTCREMESILDDNVFVKCSRNALINFNYICGIDTINGYAILYKESGIGNVKVGKKYMKELIERFYK